MELAYELRVALEALGGRIKTRFRYGFRLNLESAKR